MQKVILRAYAVNQAYMNMTLKLYCFDPIHRYYILTHQSLIKSTKISWVAQGTPNVVLFGNFIIQPFQIKIVNPKAKFHFYCFFLC